MSFAEMKWRSVLIKAALSYGLLSAVGIWLPLWLTAVPGLIHSSLLVLLPGLLIYLLSATALFVHWCQLDRKPTPEDTEP